MAVDLWDTGVTVSIVYPGVVDTELFTLPDNDPFTGDVESITVTEAVGTILDGLAAGALSIYVPGYFAEFASQKAQDVDRFLAGTAEYIRSRHAQE
jgi:NAD(P)-dependent dehydrogenase (short-subunit alcohol dehydrogenase family)